MTQPIQTHINAYYQDLITAKQEAAAANQRVIELEDAIRAKGGVVPGEEKIVETAVAEIDEGASADDVSATEEKHSNNPFKKGSK